MKPTLVVNPAGDRVFASFAAMLVEHGSATIQELERRLRSIYPNAAVHARELVGEPTVIWYVYRDGRWKDPHTATRQPAGRAEHAGSRRRSPVNRRGHS